MAQPTAEQAAALAVLLASYDRRRITLARRVTSSMLALWRYFLYTRGASATRGPLTVQDLERSLAAARADRKPTREQARTLYVEDAVQELAVDLADLSRTGQLQTFELAAQFEYDVLEALDAGPRQVRDTTDAGRKVADLSEVYLRPAVKYRYGRSQGLDDLDALELAEQRLMRLVEDDLMIAARDGQVRAVQAATGPIVGYRRVLRPELSEFGPCGLCVVAADRIYKREDLAPLHHRCKCAVMPVIGDVDPGLDLNNEDLDRIYGAAGSNRRNQLARIRVEVSQHGEIGPILHRAGTTFLTEEEADRRRRTPRRANTVNPAA